MSFLSQGLFRTPLQLLVRIEACVFHNSSPGWLMVWGVAFNMHCTVQSTGKHMYMSKRLTLELTWTLITMPALCTSLPLQNRCQKKFYPTASAFASISHLQIKTARQVSELTSFVLDWNDAHCRRNLIEEYSALVKNTITWISTRHLVHASPESDCICTSFFSYMHGNKPWNIISHKKRIARFQLQVHFNCKLRSHLIVEYAAEGIWNFCAPGPSRVCFNFLIGRVGLAR